MTQQEKKIKAMTSALQNEDEMTLVELETLMTIMTVQSRKQVLRDRLINRLTDEKGFVFYFNSYQES